MLSLLLLSVGLGSATDALATTSINKQFTAATIDPANISKFRITIANTSIVTLTAAAVTDNLPAPVIIASPANITNTCGFSGVTAAPGSSQIKLTGGTIPANTGADGQCYFELDVTSTTAGNHINTIPADGPTSGFTPGGDTAGYQATENTVTVTNTTPASATLSVRGLSPPTGTKTFSPATRYAGETSTLTIVLTNPASNNTTLPLTTFTDTLPSGMKVAATPAASVACTGTGAVNGTFAPAADDTTLTMTGGTIGGASGSGGTCTLSVNVTATTNLATATLTNTVLSGGIGNTRGLTSAPFSGALTVNTPIGLTKSFSPATVGPNQDSILTITVTNNSTSLPLTITSLTDTLPTLASPARAVTVGDVVTRPPTSTCTTGGTPFTFSPTPVQGNTSFTITNAVVGVTGARTCTITIPVRGSVGTATANSVFNNNIPANAISNPNGYASPTTGNVPLTVAPNLVVTKTRSPANAAPGVFTTYTVTINNWSGVDLTSVNYTDTLPVSNTGGYQMVLAAAPTFNATTACPLLTAGGTVNAVAGASTVSWTGFKINKGASAGVAGVCTITFRAVAPQNTPATRTFANTLPANTAICNTVTPNVCNPLLITAQNFTVNAPAALAKSFTPAAVVTGQSSVLTITVTNNTGAAVSNATLTDNFPAGLVVAATPTVGGTCITPGGGSLTNTAGGALVGGENAVKLSGATIAAGVASCTVTVNVTSADSGSYCNQLGIGALATTEGVTNPAVSNNVCLGVSGSPVTISKAFANTGNRSQTETNVLVVTLSNSSASAVTGVAVTDTLPAGVVIANAPTTATTCGGTVTAVAGSGSMGLSGATIPASGSCTFRATTIGTTTGLKTNTVPIGAVTSAQGYTNPNPATSSFTVTSSATLSKSFSPTAISQPDSALLTVQINNASPSAAMTGASLTDPLPANMVVAAAPAAGTTCSTGAVTAVPGANSISITGATVPKAGNCTFYARVTTNTNSGSFANTIPVNALSNDMNAGNAAAASATLAVNPAFTGTKTFTPGSVASGGTSRVSIQINNTAAQTMTGVTLTDPLGANLVVATPANASTTCAGSPTITATPGASTASLSGASIAAGGNCLFLFDVLTSGTPVSWTNTIPANNITSTEGGRNSLAITSTLTRNTDTSIGINKSFDPVIVTGGQPSVLRIDVTNPIGSPSGADNVTFTDTLPTGAEVYPVPNAHTDCANGLVTATPGGGSVTLSGATLPANSTCSVFVTTTSVKFLNLTNEIPVGAISTTQGYTNALSTQASLTTLQGLGASKSFTPTSISTGQTARLNIKLLSTRDKAVQPSQVLTGVSFTDNLPAGLTVAATPNATTDCTSGNVTATAGSTLVTLSGATIDPETSCLVQVDVTASVLGTYTNTIPKDTVTSNENFKNTYDTIATLNVVNPPVISKAFSPTSVKAGVVSTLTVTVTNSNTQAFTGAVLTDNLPTGLVVAGTPNASTTCVGGTVAAAVAGTSIALTNATIPASGSCTFRADVVSNTPALYPNSIPAGALTTIEGASNTDPANATLTVLQPPTVAKAFSPTTIDVGATSLLTLTLGNANAGAITLAAALTDTLPGTLVVANPNGLSGTCTLGSVTAAPAGNTIQYANGASIPPGGCTIEVLVTGAQAGSYPNVIPASALDTSAGANPSAATATLDIRAVAIGNRVWFDNGAGGGTANDGIQNGSEPGVSDVTVLLFDSSNTQVRITATNADGYYFFDNLAPGSYYVQIPAGAFSAGQPLNGYLSSSGADSGTVTDLNDNGIDDLSPALNGIRSSTFNLQPGAAPVGEDQTGYPGLLPDDSVNFTDDFGFIEPAAALVAIGNRIWRDNGAGGGGANNGQLDGSEAGIANVSVALYDSGNQLVGTTSTDANGDYWFDNLPQGSYSVRIPAGAFVAGQPLFGLRNSTGAGTDEVTDQTADENGIDDLSPTTNGIRSNTFILAVGGERTGESQTGYTGGLPDANVNGTDDFGFYDPQTTLVALGNRVWLDNGAGTGGGANNGRLDGAEAGIDAVTVELRRAADGSLVTSTQTSGGGYYTFDNLMPGIYYTILPASQFTGGGPLVGLVSASGAGGNETLDESADENGIDDTSPAVNGIRSNSFTLSVGGEPIDDDESGYGGVLPDASVNLTDDFALISPAATLVAIGNRVWLDDGTGSGGVANDGRINGAEVGIDNVPVDLYSGTGTLLGSTTTAGAGRYYFDNLAAGDYYVRIPPAAFGTGAPLAGLKSSVGAGTDETTNQELDENGIDDATPAANGIRSNTFTLTVGGERTLEGQTNYTGVLPDASVNATDDFGFYNPLTTHVAVGNRIWRDNGAGGGVANDGKQNGTEPGIDGVEVALYNSSDSLVTTTTTSGGGYYWFDDLAGGQYTVRIPASEFGSGQPLEGLLSATGAGNDETTDQALDENGIDDARPTDNGLRSNVFNLQPGTEPTDDGQIGYTGGLPNNSVNGTLDLGLIEPAATLVAIGNRVWLDDGAGVGGIANNGIQDGSELGMQNVDVQLYDSTDTLVATTNTATCGCYYFDNLKPGNYTVRIPSTEFEPGQPLAGLLSSTGAGSDETSDQTADENGIDSANPVATGIASMTFTLSVGGEQTGEDAASYTGILPDANVNATDDFGFYNPLTTHVAIGNRVWLDNGAGGGTANNGKLDGTEPGIAGVKVDLYTGADAFVATTTTDINGYYWFDDRAPGLYTVRIPASEFATGKPLAGRLSSTGAGGDETTDQTQDENGIDNATPAVNGIRSNQFNLQPGTEQTLEDQTGYTGGLPDNSVNGTNDFGFIEPAETLVAIGNRVWLDDGTGGGTANNGKLDGAEAGVEGLTVQLFDVAEIQVGTTTTLAGGYYYFDNLVPGAYTVRIPAAEFGSGEPLVGLLSSTGAGTNEVDDQGVDENGIDDANPQANGILSMAFTLSVGGERTGEDVSGYPGTLPDANLNATADFGFYNPVTTHVAIGNLLWLDDGTGSGGVANDGIRNGTEPGVAGVRVELYNAANALVTFISTDTNGRYVFDDLPSGQYYVKVPASEFATGKPLAGLLSSSGAGNTMIDDQVIDENGIDDADPAANGIRSNLFNIQAGAEPTSDDDTGYVGSLPDDSVNLTADFGFITPAATLVAIGNRVWLDDGAGVGGIANNGRLDGSEAGLDGATVAIYRASNNTLVATTTTAGGGYYYFDDLPQGTYYLRLPATDFAGGGALAGLRSSTGAGTSESVDETVDENGIDTADESTFGVRSGDFTLTVGTMPELEPQTNYPGTLPDANVNATADFGLYNPLTLVAIGNRVWLDNGAGGGTADDGVQNGTEAGLAGVPVQLFDSGNVQVGSTTTDSDGRYWFDSLQPGSYTVRIPAGAFGSGQPLEGYLSSSGADSGTVTDLSDNGIDNAAPATNGIQSNAFTLALGTMPTGEDQSGYPGALPDNSVNATDDFGFYRPADTYVAIGNLVWLDNGAGSGGVVNDGIRNGTEPGVQDLEVLLFNGSNVQVSSTITNGSGYYYFDHLVPGDYYVVIPASEFAVGQPLAGRLSSTGAGSNETSDQGIDENGIDDATPATNGIRSNTFTLSLGGERTGEDETDYPGMLPDANVNATNDFGFIEPAQALVAIGNRVWLDDGLGGGVANNGQRDGGEAGIVGVKVELYDDSDNLIDDTLTDSNGRYWFDYLVPGDYSVRIPASEFGTSKPLAGLFSSTDSTAKDDVMDEASDENGIDNAAPGTNGIGSNVFTLTVGGAPTDDDETGYSGPLPDANVNGTDDFGFYNPLTTNVAIGNRVWLDNGTGTANDGILNGGETGIDGVAVELYNGANTLIDSRTTANGGSYWFDNLPPGQYYVKLPASEFGTSRPLAGLLSSTGAGTDETTDQTGDENGIDNSHPAANGIRSNTFNLQPGTERTGEDEDGYPGGLPDSSVNATADFGLAAAGTQVAIGDRVWLDDGAGSGEANDGLRSGSEVGIGGVEVELYTSGDALIGATLTDANGRYWFDNLAAGDYYVLIPAGEFGTGKPLAGLLSSTDGTAKDEATDEVGDENGIDDPAPGTNGIRSNLFTLSLGGETTADDQTGYPGLLPDANVNATDDFGFYNPTTTNVAIGNRVWLDDGAGAGDANDGMLSGGEAGIDGVTVQLFTSGDSLVRATQTANGGYYWFDNLVPGQYYVKLPVIEFQAGGDLLGLASSTGAGTDEASDETLDENGIDNADPAANGIRSNTFNLQPGAEQTLENQDGYPGSLPDNSVNATADFGLINPATSLVAIGNRVWLDDGAGSGVANDGVISGDEAGIPNVAIQLYDGTGAFIADTLTDGSGRYWFDNLAEGSYYVQIPGTAFGSGQPLLGLVSTIDAGGDEVKDEDQDENGIDSPNPASNGVRSNTFSLTVGGETVDDDQSGYTGVLPDDSVNGTDDFGFIAPANTLVAIGNLVFRDTNGNGRYEPGLGETPIDAVTVDLFFEGDNPATVAPYRTTTTAGGGLYLFDNLPVGRYFVHIPKEEFATGGDLVGLVSSTGAGGDNALDDNADENGSDGGTPANQGLSSGIIDLAVGSEPTGEQGAGSYTGSLPDANVNLTVDLGFDEPPPSCTVICDVVAPFGTTNQADVLRINQMRGRKVTPSAANSGDCTGDGVVSVNDARACQGYYGTYTP